MKKTTYALTALLAPAAALAQSQPEGPLSSMVVVNLDENVQGDLPTFTTDLVQQVVEDSLPQGVEFPLDNLALDDIRSLDDTNNQLLISWLDKLSPLGSRVGPRFGSNCDYIAYFGEGWDADWDGSVVGSAPQYNGSGTEAWIWANHEYISNSLPTATSAPTGQHLTLAKFMAGIGVLTNDVTSDEWSQADLNAYDELHKQQLGGSWFRVRKTNGTWSVVQDSDNVRYDSTGATRLALTGTDLGPNSDAGDHNDSGEDTPEGVITGIHGDCSGGQTPWGTIITAEENVQFYYGDLEATWSSNQKFLVGNGFDAGREVAPVYAPSRSGAFGRSSKVQLRHNRDVYGYLVEIDPGAPKGKFYTSVDEAGDGRGHRKLGSAGRARWENACFAVDSDWGLLDGQPVVIYAGNDRRSGRIWKWVSNGVYNDGMTRGEVRALLDDGRLYVAHFAGLDNSTGKTLLSTGEAPTEDNPGTGQWLLVTLDSTDTPPNAAALGQPSMTIGDALKDVEYNQLGSFESESMVRRALFTVACKLGIMELNRPEDIEWNPLDPSGTPRLYVAFTNHTRQVALDQNGVLFDPEEHDMNSPQRMDTTGTVFAMEEATPGTPASSKTFTYWTAWSGTEGQGAYDAANPDNVMIDGYGGVWFGTDGNFGRNGTADAVYYLDLDPTHKDGQPGVVNSTFGLAFRVMGVPADAEATGPALSSDQRSLFVNVQHPGEDFVNNPTNWPN